MWVCPVLKKNKALLLLWSVHAGPFVSGYARVGKNRGFIIVFGDRYVYAGPFVPGYTCAGKKKRLFYFWI